MIKELSSVQYINSGLALKSIRLQLNLSQDDLAQVIGVTRSRISSWESKNNFLDNAKFNDVIKLTNFLIPLLNKHQEEIINARS